MVNSLLFIFDEIWLKTMTMYYYSTGTVLKFGVSSNFCIAFRHVYVYMYVCICIRKFNKNEFYLLLGLAKINSNTHSLRKL